MSCVLPGAAVALIMPVPIAALPGLRDLLQEFVGCELIAVADGFAAAATSLLDLPQPQDEQTVRLLRRLPTHDATATARARHPRIAGQRAGSGPGSLARAVRRQGAHALGNTLVVGRAPGARTVDHFAGGSSRCFPPALHFRQRSRRADCSSITATSVRFSMASALPSAPASMPATSVRLGDPGVELSLISLG